MSQTEYRSKLKLSRSTTSTKATNSYYYVQMLVLYLKNTFTVL